MFAQICSKLDLKPHFEGGYFKEVYRTADSSPERAASSQIYYALNDDDKSILHKVDADELWHFYLGSPIVIAELDENERGQVRRTILGSDVLAGHTPFYAVKKDHWFGAYLLSPKTWAVCGCTVAPAFVIEGFAKGKRDDLLTKYPEAKEVIHRLTDDPSPSRCKRN